MPTTTSGGSGPRVAELIAALSLATDLGMGQPLEFALRTCVLAMRLADALGLADAERCGVYYVALLRSSGCTAESTLEATIFGDEIQARTWLSTLDFSRPAEALPALIGHVGAGAGRIQRARLLARLFSTMPRLPAIERAHCEVAQTIATRLDLGAAVVDALGQVFEHWDGGGLPSHVKGEAIPVPARVVAVAFLALLFFNLAGPEAADEAIRRRSGTAFDPRIAEAFHRGAGKLLGGIDRDSAWESALAAEPAPWRRLDGSRLDAALGAIADFSDLASPFTSGHSRGVAALAAEVARRCRMSGPEVETVYHAGLVHDVGRTGIPASVWNAPRRLTEAEWERVRLHPYLTERVFARPAGLEGRGKLAALHHERLDGSGYHRGATAATLNLAARLLAASDVFQALTEPRPHRPAHSLDAAAGHLQAEVRAGRLDGEAVEAVLAAAGIRRAAKRQHPAGLSEREVEVLKLLARGRPNRQIAARLSISPATVDHHVRHIYGKIDVSTRAGATMFAMQHGLVSEAATPGEIA